MMSMTEMQMEVASYVELCTRLSRFVQLQPADTTVKELTHVLGDVLALYDRVESCDDSVRPAVDSPLVTFAAMDDLVLLSMHRLLGGFVLNSSSPKLQERAFAVFSRVLQRCKPRMSEGNAAHLQRRLAFVQSCVLYLPQPPEAKEDSEETAESATFTSQPEELRLAILQSLRELLEEDTAEKKSLQLQADQQHFFAYLVASLLHVAQRDRCREAALRAVEVLECVLVFIRDPNTLRQYLPGVSAGLWKCANAPQQISKVIVAALQCLAVALQLCVGDDQLEGGAAARLDQKEQRYTLEAIRHSAEAVLSKDSAKEETNESDKAVSNADDKWMEATAFNVDLLLSRTFAANATAIAAGTSTGLPRSSWRVRCAIAELCGTVMLQCRQALRVSFFRCFDELLVLRVDSTTEVSQKAGEILQKLQVSTLSVEERLRLLPEMADRFQMLLSTLVLKVATEHEATKVHLVRTLRGYVTFLGTTLTPYLDASIESIYSALCRVVAFAALDIELVVHHALPGAETTEEESDGTNASVLVSQFQKRLRFFHEEASVHEVLLLLHDIGSVSTPAGFIDCAFTLLAGENLMTGETGGAEVVLILNEFLRAYCPQPDNKAPGAHEHQSVGVHLIGRVLEDLLALEAWEERSSSSGNSKALVSQRALMVECVGVCAEIMGEDFKLFLLHVLYPLVEQLGSRNVEVERAALAALEKVYFLTNYESLEGLFQANMDYFVDSLCARLEQLDAYPMTAFVVEALLRHTRLASLPLVDEVATSLLRSVDLYQDSPHVDGLLRALKSLLGSIARDAEEAEAVAPATVSSTSTDLSPSRSLLADFIDEMKMLANDGADALENETEEDKTGEHEVAESGAPPTVKGAMPLEYDEIQPEGDQEDKEDGDSGYRALVIDVLDRCGYFLAESDPIACCLVLSLIDEGVRFLARHKKQLLPLVARMWPELLPRLRIDNRAIVTGAVQVITTLAEVAGDFVGDRFVETVWPILRTQLQAINVDADAKSSQLTRSMLLLSKQTTGVTDIVDTRPPEADEQTEVHDGNELSAVSGTRKSQEIRQLLAALACLTMVCQRSESVTQLVPEITRICSKYLSHNAPQEVVEHASELFGALVHLNGDEVFCTVAALADWVPPTPPSARFSQYEPDAVRRFYRGHLASLSGRGQFCRDNAIILMKRLF